MKNLLKCVCLFFFVTGLCSSAFAESKKPGQSRAKQLTKFELGKYQYCGADTDCVAVQNGCCDCANGGSDAAINRMHLEDFKARFQCEDVMCTARAKVPPCRTGVVSCVNHECRYIQSEDATMVAPLDKLTPEENEQ